MASKSPLDEWATDPAVATKYKIQSVLGSGGFGVVYAASQIGTNQQVVIKTPIRDQQGQEVNHNIERQLRRESDICAQLNHPNIVHLIDYGNSTDGSPFVVFEYVPGSTLAHQLSFGPLSLAETRHLMTQVLDALSCAHANNVAHRDLKPSNIMITETDGQAIAKVLDFGMAAVADELRRAAVDRNRDATVSATPSYCSPEQLRGESVLHSDLYSWGLIFLECLSGQPVFVGSIRDVLEQQLAPEPIYVPTWLPPHERRLLLDVIEKDANRRNISAQEVLSRLLEETPDSTRIAVREQLPQSVFWRVPARNPTFTGRTKLLEDMDQMIGGKGNLAVTALHGLGGVGKSQLAVEYAHRIRDQYRVIAWLRAENLETLVADFADLVVALDLVERSEPEQNLRFDAVRRWLESNSGWLLIFDNAPNQESVREIVPHNPDGRIVFTSRSRLWRGLAQTLEVDPLLPDDAVEFLLCRIGDTDKRAARQLADELGYLPLALEEAAAYVDESGRSVQAYIELFREHQQTLLQLASPPSDHPMTVQSTLSIGLTAAAFESGIASDLVNILAFLAPESIPLFLLKKAVEINRESAEQSNELSEIDLDRGIAALRNYSLVTSGQDGLTVHRLVQLVTKNIMQTDEQEHWRKVVLTAIEASFPRSGAEGDARPENSTLMPHALIALADARVANDRSAYFAGVLSNVGSYLGSTGQPEYACELLQEAIDIYGSLHKKYLSREARASANLALIQLAMGDMTKALENCNHALQLHEVVHGSSNYRIPQDLMSIATIQLRLGNFDEAANALDRAADLAGAIDNVNSFLAVIAGFRSRLSYRQGDPKASLAALGDALAHFDVSDVLHPFLADTLSHIALTLVAAGGFDKAVEYADRAIELGARSFGYAHPLVAEAAAIRGRARYRLGQFEAAIEDFHMALDGGERYAYRQHEDVAVARGYLVDAFVAVGDLSRARRELVRAEDDVQRVEGDIRRLRLTIGLARMNVRRAEALTREALPEAAATLRLAEETFGAEHPAIVEVLIGFADTSYVAGDVAAARSAYNRVIAILEAFPGPHVDRGLAYAGLALIEKEQNGSGAGEYVWQARKNFDAVLTEDHPALRNLDNIRL